MLSAVDVREVTLEDRRALWEWRNDAVTRKMFNINPNITYRQHCAWFERLMIDPNRVMYIGRVDFIRAGSVRFNLENADEYSVNLYLKPAYCSGSYGSLILNHAVQHLKSTRDARKIYSLARNVNSLVKTTMAEAGFSLIQEYDKTLRFEMAF